MLALKLAHERGEMPKAELKLKLAQMVELPAKMRRMLETQPSQILQMARTYRCASDDCLRPEP